MWLVWVARLWLVLGNAAALAFTVGLALLYQFFRTDATIQIGLSQLGANTLAFFVPVIATATVISIVHVPVILYSLAPARRLFSCAFTRLWCSRKVGVAPTAFSVAPITTCPPSPIGKSTAPTMLPESACERCMSTSVWMLSSIKTLATHPWWSRHNAEMRGLLMLWEVALQTFQAYKISYLVASVSINRLVALVIVTNCWFSPILHYVMGRFPVAHVHLGRLLVDASLDFIYSIVIPLAIVYPYYRDYDGSLSLYPVVFYYDDTWYVNAVSELRQVFVTSWPDLISKMSGSLSLVYRMGVVQTAIDDVRDDANFNAPTGPMPSDIGRVPSFSQVKRSRLSRLLDLVLVVWGATVASFHLTTTITSFRFYDPDCLLEMRPWGSLAYSCTSFEISCAKRHTTGDRATMDAILTTVDPLSIQNLILSNCPQLHVPPAIQRLQYLSMIKIYNSTIASWDTQTALRQVFHPQLQVIYLTRVNASGFPDGLLADDFPSTVWDIEFCITNISTYPPAITTAWAHVGIVSNEGNPELTEFPEVLATLRNVFTLLLYKNGMTTIGDRVLEMGRLDDAGPKRCFSREQLVLQTATERQSQDMLSGSIPLGSHQVAQQRPGNPIERLPDSIGQSVEQLAFLNFADTKIAVIPVAWMEITVAASMPREFVVLNAAGSLLCLSHQEQAVLKPLWLGIDCAMPLGGDYAYPLVEEDAWRSINQ